MRRTLLTTTLAIGFLLAGGCSDDDPDETAVSTTTEATTTTAAPTSTTAEAPTTSTTVAAPACPASPAPERAEEITEVTADVDGDGRGDTARTLRTGDDWLLHVSVGAGGDSQIAVDSFGGAVGVVGGADIDGDGTDEVWVRIGSGASAVILGLADFADCTLTWVTGANGERAEMPVGGSVGTASGLECETTIDPDGHITTYEAMLSGEGPDYEVTSVEHRLEGTALVEGAADGAVVSAQDAEFARYTSFSCGDLSL